MTGSGVGTLLRVDAVGLRVHGDDYLALDCGVGGVGRH